MTVPETPTCHYCGKPENFPAAEGTEQVELRPYGPGGAPVCFPCATETPERTAQTEDAFRAQLEGAEAVSPHGVAMLTDHGVEPVVDELPGLEP